MGKNPPRDGQATIRLTDMPYLPATVHDHSPQSDGMTLHTIDPDPDSDIEIYDDDREAHRSGNPPGDDDG
jgi:hypothetical protein